VQTLTAPPDPHATLTLAIRMLRNAEDELDAVLLAMSKGHAPSAERVERVHHSYLEARALAANAHAWAHSARR
jgi:hypothetical protein